MAAMIAGATIGAAAIGAGGSMLANKSSAAMSERMYKHRYQWQVRDLQKAGLNPMLSYMNAAPVPSQPRVENVGEAAVNAGARGFSAAQAAKLQEAQLRNIEFDTNLKNSQAAAADASARSADANANNVAVDTAIKSATVPFAAANAGATYRGLDANARQLNNVADRVAEEVLIKKQERIQNEDLMPLVLEYQRFMNAAAAAKIPEAQAEAQFWSTIGEGGKFAGATGKVMMLIKQMLKRD